MTERIGELRDILTKSYEDVRLALSGLAAGDLDRKTDNGWTVRQLAGHIAGSASGDIYVAKRLSAGKGATLPGFLAWIIDVGNWWGARKARKASPAEILAQWEQGHGDIVAYVNGLSDEELDRGGVVMGLGRLTTYEYLKQSPSHAQEHISSIRAAVAPPATG